MRVNASQAVPGPRRAVNYGALIAVTLLTCCFSQAPLAGDTFPAARGTLSLVFENDAFAGTDRNYTNGFEIACLSAPNRAPGAAHWLARTLMQATDGNTVYGGIGVGESIYSPQNTQTSLPLPKQHPYAGWLHLSFLTAAQC